MIQKHYTINSLTRKEKISSELIFSFLESRIEIECAFDTFKNSLEGDKTYMRDENSIRGHLFISFLALYLHCKILEHLRQKDMLDKFSVEDVLSHLSKIYKVHLGDKEITSEIPKKVRTLIDKLELPIT